MIARIIAITEYLSCVMTDGDYLNDWLTHMDHETAARMETLGRFLSTLIGA